MKKFTRALTLCLFAALPAFSQNTTVLKEKVGVLYIDSKGFSLDPAQMGNLTRLELDKTGLFEVLDKYDVQYLVEKEGLKLENCYGKICLVETGKKLRADKMLTGSVEWDLMGGASATRISRIESGSSRIFSLVESSVGSMATRILRIFPPRFDGFCQKSKDIVATRKKSA